MKWQSKEQLLELLTYLIEFESITGTEKEEELAKAIYSLLKELPYFQKNNKLLSMHELEDGRHFVSALVKKPNVTNTVILISHFDVVDIDDYGEWENLAFSPQQLTELFYRRKEELPDDVKDDIENGNWLFGRGSMDMKAGIALHLSMIERACSGEFDGNLLLLTVPDEEVNSLGMRGAVSVLNQLNSKYNLNYKACLNSEPTFSQYPGDKSNYFYTGSIGKVLAGFYCYGKETHVGEPLAGLNANLMASFITKEMELNEVFCDVVFGETTPPPTNLMQRDLKEEYSVKIPHASVTVFNVLLMDNAMDRVNTRLHKVAKKAARQLEEHFLTKANAFKKRSPSYKPKRFNVGVTTYNELVTAAIDRYGEEAITTRLDSIRQNRGAMDDRELTIKLVDEVASLMKEMAPLIVLYYSPPFYPAVNSSDHPTITKVVDELKRYAKQNHGEELVWQHYFQGLSDLSYTGIAEDFNAVRPLVHNMPLFNKGYTLPIEELKELNIPVLNVGPIGRDPHKWTERLEVDYTFTKLVDIMPFTIQTLFKND